jgi:methionyl-tRNA formyltransferase
LKNISTLQPEKIDDNFIDELAKEKYDFFFVLAYGKILPKKILDIPKLGVLNLHPSLLPQYRGPSPIMSAILDDQKETGISLIKIDEKMDHGPILIQKKIIVSE